MSTIPTKPSITDFVPLDRLGTGTFSTVYKVKRRSDSKVYALKKVKLGDLAPRQKANAVNEIRLLASLSSPYVIAYKQALFQQQHNVLCIVMEYADGGDLQGLITRFKEKKERVGELEVWKAAVQILKGLQLLHSNNVLHRDLKSANVFLAEGNYKLGDLNVSKVKKGHMAYTQTGTPYYASPEVWMDRPYDHKSDIWSFGCILYEMCCMKPPFLGEDMQELNRSIQKGKYPCIPSCYSWEMDTMIGLCLQKNPAMRPSATELLSHTVIKPHVAKFSEGDSRPLKTELLGTIQMPMNPKEFQLNLPKSKYDIKNQEEAPPPSFFKIPNYETPHRSQDRIKLSEMISDKKQITNHNTDRTNPYERVINNSLVGRKSDRKETQKSLVVCSKDLQEFLVDRNKNRPGTSISKTQLSHKKNIREDNILEVFGKAVVESVQRVERVERVEKIQTPKKVTDSTPVPSSPYKHSSASKSVNQNIESSDRKPRTPQLSLDKITRDLRNHQHSSSKRKQLHSQLDRVQQLKCNYMGDISGNPVINRLESKLQKYYPNPRNQNKKYNIMPSWWG